MIRPRAENAHVSTQRKWHRLRQERTTSARNVCRPMESVPYANHGMTPRSTQPRAFPRPEPWFLHGSLGTSQNGAFEFPMHFNYTKGLQMGSYENALSVIKELASKIKTDFAGINEDTTRLRYIDTILFESLGWDKYSDAVTEKRQKLAIWIICYHPDSTA